MGKVLKIILPTAAFIVIALIFYRNWPALEKGPTPAETGSKESSSQEWETKTDDQADVSVAITPIDLSAQSAQWKFDITLNTHSIELDQDLVKSSLLFDDQGRQYDAISWEGSRGGHHVKGILTFVSLVSPTASVELKIQGIAGVARSFVWQLK